MMRLLYLFILVFVWIQASSQQEEIPLVNPSFEGTPAAGTNYRAFLLGGWFDCAPYYFKGQTPPDVQPGTMEFFDVTTKPQDGKTYLGMVTRQNETWELVSQRLIEPLEKSNCYSFEIELARSNTYFSQLLNQTDTTKRYNFNKPIVLRIWGGRNVYEKRELLAESPIIAHTEWRNYRFEFNVNQQHDYLILEAFYKTPTLLPYNGNILLDNASVIRQIDCPEEEDYLVSVMERLPETETTENATLQRPKKRKVKETRKSADIVADKSAIAKADKSQYKSQGRILKQLDSKKLKEGQTIKIEQLYFEADSSNFTQGSYTVLDEIFVFLKQNPGVVIEIGGHTNGIPGQQYCQTLSLKRAKSVADYLYNKGIPQSRIVFKGYGKGKPIASNKTHIGRQKNQRVEIKILKLS